MTLAVAHSTASDGTFSASGAVAWNANHSLSGTADVTQGGTGAGNAATARTNLGVPSGSGTSTGTNTGDQTITLTGAVTGSGTGSFATTLTGPYSATSFTSGALLFGNGTGALQVDADLTWAGSVLTAKNVVLDSSGAGVSIIHTVGATDLQIFTPNISSGYAGGLLFKSGDSASGSAQANNWYSGSGGINGGIINISSGNGGTGAGGNIGISGGYGYSGGASVSLTGGFGNGPTARGGSITATPGYGYGAAGVIDLQDSGNNSILKISAGKVAPGTTGAIDLGDSTHGFKRLYIDFTNTATVGNVTINKASGTVNMAALGTTLTLTNSLIATTSRVMLTLASNPGANVGDIFCVLAAGSCTITCAVAVVNQTKIAFQVIN